MWRHALNISMSDLLFLIEVSQDPLTFQWILFKFLVLFKPENFNLISLFLNLMVVFPHLLKDLFYRKVRPLLLKNLYQVRHFVAWYVSLLEVEICCLTKRFYKKWTWRIIELYYVCITYVTLLQRARCVFCQIAACQRLWLELAWLNYPCWCLVSTCVAFSLF